MQDRSAIEIFASMMSTLNDAAEHSIPPKQKKCTRELWKDDGKINHLISLRTFLPRNSDEYKEQIKRIKKRVNKLKNEKVKQEAEDINNFARKREVEELYRAFKDDSSTFKESKSRKVRSCDTLYCIFRNISPPTLSNLNRMN